MEKRVIIFLVLSLAIILSYDYLLKEFGLAPKPSPQTKPASQAAPPPAASQSRTGSPESSGEPVQSPPPAGRQAAANGAPAVPATGEQTVEVVTPLYRAQFTNRGAEIKGWELARYRTADREQPKPVQLLTQHDPATGPLAIHTVDPKITKRLREGLYGAERDFSTLDAEHPTGHVMFTYREPESGARVTKRLTFHHDSYLVDISVQAEGLAGPLDVGLGANFGIVEWGEGFIGLIGPASLVDDQVEKSLPEAELERKGAVRWVALQDKYFLSVLIPTGASAVVVRKEGDKLATARVRFSPATDAAAGTANLSLKLYAGPKEYDGLRALNVGLEETIDFGWFIYGSWDIVRAVAKPLFYVLRFLYDFTHNYGVSIVLLTVGIKLLFVPLQYKSYKSMKEMQFIQPKVVALQSKYKDDRERLNRELIKLYRDHKVNPVGGCLPMLLQMPVFVALFNILYMTIDLRQAPFLLWITDLSVQDPYYVLPILMGVSMVVQQKIMPSTMDPAQAKIMLLLPVFMTFLFLTFPAGLVLYWLTNNVLTITQQFVTDRYVYKQPTFASAPESGGAEAQPDGQKQEGKRRKDRGAEKVEADSRVET
jgi:YidC/Oxa1 family membrane protein insertase